MEHWNKEVKPRLNLIIHSWLHQMTYFYDNARITIQKPDWSELCFGVSNQGTKTRGGGQKLVGAGIILEDWRVTRQIRQICQNLIQGFWGMDRLAISR